MKIQNTVVFHIPYHSLDVIMMKWSIAKSLEHQKSDVTGISLGMPPANERHRHNVTKSLIGWANT